MSEDDFGGEENPIVTQRPDTYDVIAMDPPWNETGGGKIKRGADKHYPVLKRDGILSTIVRAPAWRPADNAHLYMWTTMSSLLDATWLMDALGFKYTSHLVWFKADEDDHEATDWSLGQYFRGQHELLLFGTRGKGFALRSEDRSIPSVIVARVPRDGWKRIHSRKPDEAYERIEKRSIGRKLEMFARLPRPGWDVWGDEVGE